MTIPASAEIARQYRVAKQILAMHCDLRDSYARLGLTLQIVFVVFTAVTSATTFAGDEFYQSMHVTPETGRLIFGAVAVIAFSGSLVLLIVDPRGRSAKHADAANEWTDVVFRFRELRREDDSWHEDACGELNRAYGAACKHTAPIPDRKFNRLKSRYLRKVESSKLKTAYPGCPIFILSGLVRMRDTLRAAEAFYRGGAGAESPESKH